jgi:hypothetical protein
VRGTRVTRPSCAPAQLVRVTSESRPSHVRVTSESRPSPSHVRVTSESESRPSHVRVTSESREPSASPAHPSHFEKLASHCRTAWSLRRPRRDRSTPGRTETHLERQKHEPQGHGSVERHRDHASVPPSPIPSVGSCPPAEPASAPSAAGWAQPCTLCSRPLYMARAVPLITCTSHGTLYFPGRSRTLLLRRALANRTARARRRQHGRTCAGSSSSSSP